MQEKRRHQRIRFGQPPAITIGFGGMVGKGTIENISVSGLMLRTDMQLGIGRTIGCEFSIFGSTVIDVPAVVVSRVGDLFGVRFEPGPISEILIEDGMSRAMASGLASMLSVHEIGGRKVMRIVGGLNASLTNDFMYSLTRVGIDEIDVEGVTAVDREGLALCMQAEGRHGVRVGQQSACFAEAWRKALNLPGGA